MFQLPTLLMAWYPEVPFRVSFIVMSGFLGIQVAQATHRLQLKEAKAIGLQACRLRVQLRPSLGLPPLEESFTAGRPRLLKSAQCANLEGCMQTQRRRAWQLHHTTTSAVMRAAESTDLVLVLITAVSEPGASTLNCYLFSLPRPSICASSPQMRL